MQAPVKSTGEQRHCVLIGRYVTERRTVRYRLPSARRCPGNQSQIRHRYFETVLCIDILEQFERRFASCPFEVANQPEERAVAVVVDQAVVNECLSAIQLRRFVIRICDARSLLIA